VAPPYPAHWEADVVLRDGGTCHLRPIRADDADALRRFHARLSPETIYFRFFAPYPRLSDRDLRRFTEVDHNDRVALVATIGEEVVGVVRYDRLDSEEAEVAFVIRDDHQGRGLGTVFLEHIAQAARERGVRRFVAEILPENIRMLEVFRHAGYTASTSVEEGVTRLDLALQPTESSLAVTRSREQRAEALSIERLMRPRSVAVVGAGRDPHSVGHTVVRHLLNGGFTGQVLPVNPNATEIEGLPCAASLGVLPGPVDLVVVAVPAAGVLDVVDQAAAVGAHALLVVSAGFAETGADGRQLQDALVHRVRADGMRLIGPNALGMVNSDPDVSMNASLSPVVPGRGRIGFFSQSGALGVALLEAVVRRGLGLSTFLSAGNRSDVSGNDLLQYWADDPATDLVLLYLESIGNPRKFSRIARRLGREKPIVAVKTGRAGQGMPLGHTVRGSILPADAVDALFDQSGVVRTATVAEMFDVAKVLSFQPLPQGRRVAAVGNSDAMAVLAADALAEYGLQLVEPPTTFPVDAAAADFERALAAAADDPAVDALLTLFVPALHDSGESVARALARVAGRVTKPMVVVIFGVEGAERLLRRLSPDGVPEAGSVPTFAAVEDAARALGAVTDYAEWRRAPLGTVVDLPRIDAAAARGLVDQVMDDAGLAEIGESVELDDDSSAQLLACYGIDVWPRREVRDARGAAEAADDLGYPVVLKTVWPNLRLRSDLGGIWFQLPDARAVRRAFGEAQSELSRLGIDRYVVQRQAPAGVSVVLTTQEDPLFGPVVSFGVAGMAYDVLADRSYRVPPFTDTDVEALVQGPRAAQLLSHSPGLDPLDVQALQDVVARVGRMADDLPEIASLRLRPVVVSPSGVAVLSAELRVARPLARTDLPARRLLG
jgi:acyl-CoA synthetase (NDP forming)/RimJ/RimL family protein N-acetyltransferase